ncbi:cyclin-like protein [Limtongia smithiae]|uniref:cyclin-like protein n=1 Tax=Limtongia smithiae TaxID=1125753 RepID=UPI0034CD0974
MNTTPLAHLSNALASPAQIQHSHTRGISPTLVSSLHNLGASVIQISCVLLKVSPDVAATAAILFHRFHLVVSFFDHNIRDTVAGAVYIAAKMRETELDGDDVLDAIDEACQDPLAVGDTLAPNRVNARKTKRTLYQTELEILTTLSFDMQVLTPYTFCLKYVSAIGIVSDESRARVFQRAWNYMNDTMKTRIPILHQANTIAVTALWLASREAGVELLDGEAWWQVFDVDSEDMGHAMLLLREGHEVAVRERKRVEKGMILGLTVDEVIKRVVEESSG